ncbi:DHHA1 domain protein [Candidatus Gugararchaeum adminiculabundum]|nr:DHHA1 domain protein [Candidatus Gugararchaeum adminiculabundum]
MGNEHSFFAKAAEAKEEILKLRQPLVLGHYDCDGICSTAIAHGALNNAGISHRVRNERKLDEKIIHELNSTGEKELLFCDLGSSVAAVQDLKADTIIILDHHPPAHKKGLQINPHIFGFDGAQDICSAGVAYSVFKEYLDVSLVGMIGDMQYPISQKKLNSIILKEGQEKKAVKVETDITFFGRMSRPLQYFLSYADDPFLPGLTANEEKSAQFVESLGIKLKKGEDFKTYADLDEEEKRELVSGIVTHLESRGMHEAAKSVIGEVYTLLQRQHGSEFSDAKEFSTIMNACGRNDRADIGISTCLGELGASKHALTLLQQHRVNLRNGIEFAQKNYIDLGKFYFLDARGIIDDGIIGVVAGMLYAPKRTKPIFACALDKEGGIKFSGRGTRLLVANGLDLGKILSQASASVGGAGGGHNIAAGATIPNEKLNEFLLELGKLI